MEILKKHSPIALALHVTKVDKDLKVDSFGPGETYRKQIKTNN